MRALVTTLSLLSLLWAGAALAQAPPAASEPVVTRRQVMVFEPDAVGGRRAQPGTEVVQVRLRRIPASLVQIRRDFDRELVQSAEEL